MNRIIDLSGWYFNVGKENDGPVKEWCPAYSRLYGVLHLDVLQELEAIKARVLEMEEEAEKLKEVQYESERRLICSPPGGEFPFFRTPWESRLPYL